MTSIVETEPVLAPAAIAVAPAARPRRNMARLRAVVLGLIVPVALLVVWHVMVKWTGTRLVPTPYGVGVMMWDFAFGGIYDDAYSATLPIHFWKSVQRVYGGFFCAALLGIPEGGKPVAILCLGHVAEFYPKPMLELEGWAQRGTLGDFVTLDRW